MLSEPLAGQKILVVEDDFWIAVGLTDTLESAGAEILGPASTVEEALNLLDPRPDVATLDIRLADETSFPIADELARRGIPFVFATGSADTIPDIYKTRTVCEKPLSSTAIVKALADAVISQP